MLPLRPTMHQASISLEERDIEGSLTLYGIIERQDMHTLAVLDVMARVNMAEIAQLDTQVVSRDYRGCVSQHPAIASPPAYHIPLFIWIFPSSTSSELRQIRTSAKDDQRSILSTPMIETRSPVSFLFLPLECDGTKHVSERKQHSPNWSQLTER